MGKQTSPSYTSASSSLSSACPVTYPRSPAQLNPLFSVKNNMSQLKMSLLRKYEQRKIRAKRKSEKYEICVTATSTPKSLLEGYFVFAKIYKQNLVRLNQFSNTDFSLWQGFIGQS